MSRSNLKLAQVGHVKSIGSSEISDATLDVANTHKRTYEVGVANGTASTNIDETEVVYCRRDAVVKSIAVVAPAAVTASDLNFKAITVAKRTGSGSAVTLATVNTQTTGSGNLAAFVPYELTLSCTLVCANDTITVKAIATNNGVALSAATSLVKVSVDLEEDNR